MFLGCVFEVLTFVCMTICAYAYACISGNNDDKLIVFIVNFACWHFKNSLLIVLEIFCQVFLLKILADFNNTNLISQASAYTESDCHVLSICIMMYIDHGYLISCYRL